jgi:probable rRNA maturation factor
MIDLIVDADVPVALRRKLRTEVGRMVRAAARAAEGEDFEISLTLTGDAAIQALNRVYRKKDKPTDVLAFAQREGPSGALHPGVLGDIVISVDTARRQARRGLYAELVHLAAHGLCHLLGYDHRGDAEERTMNARMAALRCEGGRRGRIRPA